MHSDSWAAAEVIEIVGRSAAEPIAAASPRAQAPGARPTHPWARLQARSRLPLSPAEAKQLFQCDQEKAQLTAKCVDKMDESQ